MLLLVGLCGVAGGPGGWVATPVTQPQAYGLTVSVSEGRGQAVSGLVASDFLVRFGDVAVTVLEAERDPRPVSIVVIADGMEAEEALHARAALSAVLRRLRQTPGTRVGLMLGEGGARAPELRDAQEATVEHNRRVSRFFRAEVTAPPQDTLAGAAEALLREEGRRRVVLVLSVNRRMDRVPIPEGLMPLLRRADILLGALEVSAGAQGQRLDAALQLIHSTIGGRFERVPDITALESSATRLVSSLMSAYLVTFATDAPISGAPDVRIKDRPRVTVITPNWALR